MIATTSFMRPSWATWPGQHARSGFLLSRSRVSAALHHAASVTLTTFLNAAAEDPGEAPAEPPADAPADPPADDGAPEAPENPGGEGGDSEPAAPNQPGGNRSAATTNSAMPGRQPPVNAAGAGEPRPDGNAVYRIDPDGFVTEIFRQRVLVLSMVERDGLLLLGTGSDGLVYQLNPAADETVVVAKVEPKQVMALLPTRDDNIYLGMANTGGLATLSAGHAAQGTYTSPVLDATQVSKFGKL
ncbi:MAG: hypothetical protein KY450_08570, partial [Actinobacteria bacterium]|nr:hypothetical protein [Actinomycetota bacterium]